MRPTTRKHQKNIQKVPPYDDRGPVRAGRARKAIVYHSLARPRRGPPWPSVALRAPRSNVATLQPDMLHSPARTPIVAMTDNRNPEAAWTYHDATKHSCTSIRTNPHFMDWSNQPLPFKIYPTLELMRLPGEVRQTGVAALSAIAESVPARTDASPDLEAIAQLLYLSAGITRKRSYSGGEIY